MTTVRRTLAVAAAAALVALGPAAARPASAAAAGKPGYCTDDSAVTVVVDFSALGGDVVVRCATGPGGRDFTGLDALNGAGFSAAGVERWGLQFVCRIQGRPTAREDLAIPGDDSYHEACGDTPPDTAYWTYWSAPNGGSWKYNSVSAASRSTVQGGFEGWSFHLGSGSPKPPPVSPKHEVEAPTSSPPTTPSGGHHSGGGSGGPGSPPSPTSSPTSSATTAPTSDQPSTSDGKPRRRHHGSGAGGPSDPTTTPPSSSTPTTQRADGPTISTALPEQPDDGGSGSATPFLIGAGILVLLGAGAGATAWRRSHHG